MKNSQTILKTFSKERIEKLFEKIGYGVTFSELRFVKTKLKEVDGVVDGYSYSVKSKPSICGSVIGGAYYEQSNDQISIDLGAMVVISN